MPIKRVNPSKFKVNQIYGKVRQAFSFEPPCGVTCSFTKAISWLKEHLTTFHFRHGLPRAYNYHCCFDEFCAPSTRHSLDSGNAQQPPFLTSFQLHHQPLPLPFLGQGTTPRKLEQESVYTRTWRACALTFLCTRCFRTCSWSRTS